MKTTNGFGDLEKVLSSMGIETLPKDFSSPEMALKAKEEVSQYIEDRTSEGKSRILEWSNEEIDYFAGIYDLASKRTRAAGMQDDSFLSMQLYLNGSSFYPDFNFNPDKIKEVKRNYNKEDRLEEARAILASGERFYQEVRI